MGSILESIGFVYTFSPIFLWLFRSVYFLSLNSFSSFTFDVMLSFCLSLIFSLSLVFPSSLPVCLLHPFYSFSLSLSLVFLSLSSPSLYSLILSRSPSLPLFLSSSFYPLFSPSILSFPLPPSILSFPLTSSILSFPLTPSILSFPLSASPYFHRYNAWFVSTWHFIAGRVCYGMYKRPLNPDCFAWVCSGSHYYSVTVWSVPLAISLGISVSLDWCIFPPSPVSFLLCVFIFVGFKLVCYYFEVSVV